MAEMRRGTHLEKPADKVGSFSQIQIRITNSIENTTPTIFK
jgi:hypothetical protein